LIDLQASLRELRKEFNSIASAVLSRDGLMIAADIPDDIMADTFTIMCATMMGAASTAHSELKMGQPKTMRVLSEKFEMIIVGAGKRAIVVSVVPHGCNIDSLLEKVNSIVDSVSES